MHTDGWKSRKPARRNLAPLKRASMRQQEFRLLLTLAVGMWGLTGCQRDGGIASGRQALSVIEQLDAPSRAALASTAVRPLVPPARLVPKARLMSGPSWYAFSVNDDELTISLHATNRVHHHLHEEAVPDPRFEVRGRPARVARNEAIQAVSWDEQGTFYALEVECFRALEDERCKTPHFALDLAEELVEP